MNTTIAQFESWLNRPEDVDLEFKESEGGFGGKRGSLNDYCAAIANGKGGKLLLGVDDDGFAVGTNSYKGTHAELSHQLWEALKIHIDVEEVFYKGLRVLIFHIPKHSPGIRAKSGVKGDKYVYPIRRGESLGEMDDHKTREILNEVQPDFSAGIVPSMGLADVDALAVDILKKKWAGESKRSDYAEC